MSIVNLHKADKIVVGGSFTFNECRNWRFDAGMSSLIRRPAGHVAPMFRAGLQQRPVWTFTTSEIATVWANIGQYGLAVTADTDIYEKLAVATGNAARNASSHKRYRISDCFIFWSRVSLPHNGEGTIDVSIIPVYDGSNEPIVPAGSTALITTQSVGDHFGAGPVAWNGTTLNGIQSIEIATNPQLIQEGGESEIWDTWVGMETIDPVVTLNFRDATSLTGIGLDGTVLNGSTGLTLFARHMTGVGRSANGASAHLKLLGANGTIIPQEIGTQDSAPTMHSARVELVAASDSTDPMTLTTGTTIS